MEKKKSTFQIVLVVVVLVLIYVGYKKYQKAKKEKEEKGFLDPDRQIIEFPTDEIVLNVKASGEKKPMDGTKVVGLGSRGEEVLFIQQGLNRILIKEDAPELLKQDRIFGAKTEAALYRLTGKRSASYNQVKKTVKEWFKKNNLPDPYDNSSNYTGHFGDDTIGG